MIVKYRGKSIAEKNKGAWVYGNLIVDDKNAYIVNGVIECTQEYISLNEWCPVDIETVGQFTGLFDTEGFELYEDDVIEYADELAETDHDGYVDGSIEVTNRLVITHNGKEWGFKEAIPYGGASYLKTDEHFSFVEIIERIKGKIIGSVIDEPNLMEELMV